jgi:hypothetical protein
MTFRSDAPPDDEEQILDWLVRGWIEPDTVQRVHGDPEFRRPLGPEDDRIRAKVMAGAVTDLPPTGEADARMQPDGSAVCGELRPYLSQSGRSGTTSVLHRSWSAMLYPVAPVLMVPGRPVLGRARVAALASLLLVDGGLLSGWGAGREPLLATLLDLACRGHWVQRARQVALALPQRPTALATSEPLLANFTHGKVKPHPLPRDARGHFRALVGELVGALTPGHVTPGLGDPAATLPGDDARLPLDRVYERGMRAAQRLACACLRIQVHAAGVAAAIAEATTTWQSGAPRIELRAALAQLDEEVGWATHLLAEIARAIQRRSVQPNGVRNGLRKVAATVDQAFLEFIDAVEPLLGGAIPATPDLWAPIHALALGDPLAEAWQRSSPMEAVPWLLGQPASVDRDLAVIFTRAGAGVFAGLGVELFMLSRRPELKTRPTLFAAADLVAASAALHDRSYEPALILSQETYDMALQRRNGVLLAASALGMMEAYFRMEQPDRAEQIRLEASRVCRQLRNAAGLTLLLRWREADEPEDEPEEFDDDDLPTDEVSRTQFRI